MPPSVRQQRLRAAVGREWWSGPPLMRRGAARAAAELALVVVERRAAAAHHGVAERHLQQRGGAQDAHARAEAAAHLG